MPDFESRVIEVIAALGPGDVATYGEIAADAGNPGAARIVGNILRTSSGLPWWRVVAADGRLVPGAEQEHADRLRRDGIALTPSGKVPTAVLRKARP